MRKRIKAIEQSIVHYGDTTLFFADQLKQHGPAYASAVAMEEATLVDFNKARQGHRSWSAIYPARGHVLLRQPATSCCNAPWVRRAAGGGAEVRSEYLGEQITPETARDAGFRPGDPTKQAGARRSTPRTAPTRRSRRRVLSLPEPRVLAGIKRAWRADRKAANVMLVVDTSGSMGEESKLDQAKEGLRVFFRELSPRDRVGLITFNDKVVTARSPIAPVRANAAKLLKRRQRLVPGRRDGRLRRRPRPAATRSQSSRTTTRINAVVVLTDGEDNQSQHERQRAGPAAQAPGAGRRSMSVRVFTIAYGRQANQDVLAQIAAASGGKEYSGDPTRSSPSTARSPASSDDGRRRRPPARQLHARAAGQRATKPVNVLVARRGRGRRAIAIGARGSSPWRSSSTPALAALTFFDADEAERVGKRVYGESAKRVEPPKQADLSKLAPPIGQQLAAARAEEARIRTSVQEADLPFEEVTAEVDSLVRAMESIAIRAQRVYDYLSAHDPRPVQARLSQLDQSKTEGELAKALREQLAAYSKLSAQLERFYEEMEHITASLSTVGAQVVSMSAAGEGESGQRELAGQVRDLREQVNALSDGMREAYASQPDTP